jgi:hypothetical protein
VLAAEIRAADASLGYQSGAAREVVKRMAPHGELCLRFDLSQPVTLRFYNGYILVSIQPPFQSPSTGHTLVVFC